MGRKHKRIDRGLQPDAKYSSVDVTKIINFLMWDGKKAAAQEVMYDTMDILKDKIHENPVDIVQKAFNNVKPIVEVKSRRIGGSTYQIPVEVTSYRAFYLAWHWIIDFARKRSGHSMAEKLANELMDAYKNQGSAIKKKEDTHKMAEANKAFAHLRW